jgi:hypothetical protein
MANSSRPSQGPVTPRVSATPSSQRTLTFSFSVKVPTDFDRSLAERAVNWKPQRAASGCSSLTVMVCLTPGL